MNALNLQYWLARRVSPHMQVRQPRRPHGMGGAGFIQMREASPVQPKHDWNPEQVS